MGRRKKKVYTQRQGRQRELAWALYITEGYVANIAHLEAVNAFTLNRNDLRLIEQARVSAEETATMLREAMHYE